MRGFFILFVIFTFCSSTAWADVLYLKDGRKLKGEIYEQTGYSYKIKVDGIPYTYYSNEVTKAIKGDEPVEPQAGPAEPVKPQEITKQKTELIQRLLETNGARETMSKIFNQILTEVPQENRPALQELLKVDEVIKRIVPIYAKYYTDDELRELINFYSSPVGKKHIQTTPKVMEETMREAAKYFQEKVTPSSPKQ